MGLQSVSLSLYSSGDCNCLTGTLNHRKRSEIIFTTENKEDNNSNVSHFNTISNRKRNNNSSYKNNKNINNKNNNSNNNNNDSITFNRIKNQQKIPPNIFDSINIARSNISSVTTDILLRNLLVNMAAKTLKDTYDYILIDSGSPDSYLISSEVDSFFLNDSASSSSTNGLLINASLYGDASSNSTLLLLNNGSGSITLDSNSTNSTEDIGELIVMAATSIVLGLMILITVIGNVFVIAAIILERNLQNVANYLVASLAVADLFVACLVMPLGAVYEISKGWILGPELCDIWTSCDVLCCTASILHLVAIATDRFWAVTNVDYIHSRTRSRVFTMIFLVWFAAVIVSLAPQFGWKDPEYLERIEQQKCMVSQDVAYQVFATCCTFYVPLLVILVLYWKIYQTARKRIHRRPRPVDVTANNNQPVPQKKKTRLKIRLASKFSSQGKSAASSLGLVEGNSTNTVNTVEDTEYSSNVDSKKGIEVTTFNNADEGPTSSTSQISTVSHLVSIANQTSNENQNSHPNQVAQTPTIASAQKIPSTPQGLDQVATSSATTPTAQCIPVHSQQASNQVTPIPQSKQGHHTSGTGTGTLSSVPNPHSQVSKRKETLEAKRERKAAKTLAIITGAFVVCWLPFFLMALLLPLCGESCHINDTIASLFLWLGYFNSTLNPVIYTIFSPEFRQAFKRILFGGHRPNHYRSGKI